MTKEELKDVDLDVINLTGTLPEDEDTCYLYMRGDEESVFVCSSGAIETFTSSICSAMKSQIGFEEVILCSALLYLENDEKLRGIFKESLTQIDQEK